ncbi:MAG: hypothetical protein LUC34_05870, partial [Campylobacter sp.]|nr:hypothetical protein [Campylobacter sp.]
MRELIFEIKFKSAVVLPATSNNEGKVSDLDFIPGSNFLGMVAKKYSEFSDPFKIFHSGSVRFGDAMPFIKGKKFYKIPLSYFHEKDEKNDENMKIYNHHFIGDFTRFNQLKQMREGFMSMQKDKFMPEYTYSQKSAYDKDKRQSKEGMMYGYNALQAGSTWIFSVKIDDDVSSEDEKLIKDTLCESTMLGKSKTAEYGEVEIGYIKPDDVKEHKLGSQEPKFTPDFTYLYANSRLALVDENGNATYELRYITPGLSDENVCYEKCQLRFSSFTPYNGARATKDYERICINKGSVIVLKNLTDEQKEAIEKGVGAYLCEGFGEVFINHQILSGGDNDNPLNFKKPQDNQDNQNDDNKDRSLKSDLAKFLLQKEQKRRKGLDIAKAVSDFIDSEGAGKKLKGISNS